MQPMTGQTVKAERELLAARYKLVAASNPGEHFIGQPFNMAILALHQANWLLDRALCHLTASTSYPLVEHF